MLINSYNRLHSIAAELLTSAVCLKLPEMACADCGIATYKYVLISLFFALPTLKVRQRSEKSRCTLADRKLTTLLGDEVKYIEADCFLQVT